MKTLALGILIVWVASFPALGRIGETEAQITERYGKPSVVGEPEADGLRGSRYHFGPFSIVVFFSGGISVTDNYRMTDGSKFSTEQAVPIMKANGGAQAWKMLDDTGLEWVTVSYDLGAKLEASMSELTVWSRASIRSSIATDKKKIDEALKGFDR